MPIARVAGAGILEARVVLPQSGAWTADLALDTDAVPTTSGQVSFTFGALQLTGTAIRGGPIAGAAMLRVVGGAGGLGKALAPKDYRGVPLRIPLEDALTAAGETLSATADATALAYQLPRWVRFAQSAGQLVQALADEVGSAWRVLPDGTVWVGTDSFADAGLSFDLLRGDPHLDMVEIGVESPSLVPGQSLMGRHVASVEHLITEGAVRSLVSFV